MSDTSCCPKCYREVLLPLAADPTAWVRCPLCATAYQLREAIDYTPPELELIDEPTAGAAVLGASTHDDLTLANEPSAAAARAAEMELEGMPEWSGSLQPATRQYNADFDGPTAVSARSASDVSQFEDSADDDDDNFNLAESNDATAVALEDEDTQPAFEFSGASAGTYNIGEDVGPAFGGPEGFREAAEVEEDEEEDAIELAPLGARSAPPAVRPLTTPTRTPPRPKRKEKSAPRLMAEVILGGAGGVVIAFAIIMWGMQKDPLKLGPSLPAWMVPEALRGKSAGPVASNTLTNPAVSPTPSGMGGAGGSDPDEAAMGGQGASPVVPNADPEDTDPSDTDAGGTDLGGTGAGGTDAGDPDAVPAETPEFDPTQGLGDPGIGIGGLDPLDGISPLPTVDPTTPPEANDEADPATGNPAIGDPTIGDPTIGNPAIGDPSMPDGADGAQPSGDPLTEPSFEISPEPSTDPAGDPLTDPQVETNPLDDTAGPPEGEMTADPETPGADGATEPAADVVVSVRNAPAVDEAAILAAQNDALKAQADLAAAADDAAKKKAGVTLYRKLSPVAQAVTFAGTGPGGVELVDTLIRQATAGEGFEAMGRLAAKWTELPKPPAPGVLLTGSVQSVEAMGPMYHTRLALAGGNQVLDVLSARQPAVAAGDQVIVLGSILDNPAENLEGLPEGDLPAGLADLSRVIWTRTLVRHTDASTTEGAGATTPSTTPATTDAAPAGEASAIGGAAGSAPAGSSETPAGGATPESAAE